MSADSLKFSCFAYPFRAVLTPTTAQPGIGANAMWNMFGSVKADKALELRADVNNLFERELPIISSSQNDTDSAIYDPIGRSFYIGPKAAFGSTPGRSRVSTAPTFFATR